MSERKLGPPGAGIGGSVGGGEPNLNVRLLGATDGQVKILASDPSKESRPSESQQASMATVNIGVGDAFG